MNIESLATNQTQNLNTSSTRTGAEAIERDRDAATDNTVFSVPESSENQQVQPEELLQTIKALTDNGRYSVRFEMHKETNDVIINLIEHDSGDVIRQIPPEEILGLRETLANLRGNLVDTES